MEKLAATLAELRAAAEKHKACCVAYSGGKDSITVLDLCTRAGFERVEAVFMYFAPGIELEESKCRWAEERYGVKVHQMPHPSSIGDLKLWHCVDPQPALAFLPDWTMEDAYRMMMLHTKSTCLALGQKKADSSWRRRFMKGTEHWQFVINPIAEWNKFDVLGYLAAKGIPIPEARAGKNATGIGLGFESVLFLHDTAPEDFERFCEYFPYARAYVAHREFYGQAGTKGH